MTQTADNMTAPPGTVDRETIRDLGIRLQEKLDRSQWLSPEDLMRYRRRTLAPLIVHAHETVPFYADRLSPLFDGAPDGRWERWAMVPTMSRSDLLAEGERLMSTAIPERHLPVSREASSGSTGIPLEIVSTRFSGLMKNALESRMTAWAGLDPAKKLASIKVMDLGKAEYPEGVMRKAWTGLKPENGSPGTLVRLNMMTPVHQQAEWLIRHEPAYLSTFPTNARALANHFAANGLELPSLEKVLPYGEMVTEDIRDCITEVFGAAVYDNYSATECGLIALQCPDGPGYHLMNETVIVEVLDADGRQSQPGETGQVVLTTMHNYAQPLIRYRLGDLVEVGEPCTCGRHLPVINRIAGRSRHMFCFPDGTEILPDFRAKNLLKFIDPAAWQIAQTGSNEIQVRYVPGNSGREPDFDGMTDHIRKSLGVEVDVSYVRREAIQQASSGKIFDYVCEI